MSRAAEGASGDGAEDLLAEALGYVAAWRGRTVAVKVGGSVLADGVPEGLAEDLALLHRAGVRTVLVHGGGPEVSGVLEKMGGSPEFVDGLRVTDGETMDVVVMVLAGRVNKRIVLRLQEAGVRAAGVSGVDAGLLRVRSHPAADRLGRVGEVERVDPSLVETLFDGGFLPVVSPVGTDGRGRCFNVNADAAAAALASALGAEKLVLVTDVEGILRESGGGVVELVPELTPGEARGLIAEGTVSRGMVPKVEACLAALEKGVHSAHVVGTATEHAVLRELLTDRGAGTMIRSAPAVGPEDERDESTHRIEETGT
ncbi:MAG: acetylglutamate kinase [Candidatus Palauibacterales bacterium]|nr:acetylglutamate kinase [Candidatus Palauibacterales bacterium]